MNDYATQTPYYTFIETDKDFSTSKNHCPIYKSLLKKDCKDNNFFYNK